MHREDIKAAIRKKGETLTSIASALKVTPMAVGHVVAGRQRSARVAQRISQLIGTPVSEIWPSKYPQLELAEQLAAEKTRNRLPNQRAATKRRAA